MSESPFSALPAPIAGALEQRGFTALTPIQERVLDSALAGRDLRIASQTGSGKTVAIGFVLLPELEAAEQEKTRSGPAQPQALLIAPTRELAAQLQRELTWLLEPLKIGVAVVAGGASYPAELRALKQKPLVVVGTPGRLLDHLEKGHIDPSALGTVVLDEADQMLDLGFRDELESILGHTPDDRRTHLVSATFSRDVLSLAQKFQRDAVMVEGTALGSANRDISHVVHLVRAQDRLSAIINILLMAPDERALLFVRTRADATELSGRLTEAGFHALPLSGELEQRERNKTLEAFRNGVVDTLVATDVAARGLDISDVGRVIHVDPPSDDEGLTHRSGRTGRAGKKGISIMLVMPSAEERVRSIFRRAKIEPVLAPVPTPAEVIRAADERVVAELEAELAAFSPDPRLEALAERLLEEHGASALVQTLLARVKHTGPCEPREVKVIEPARSRAPAPRRPRESSDQYVAYRINWGERDGADPRRLLAMVCRRGRITGDQVGAIRISLKESLFEVSAAVAQGFERAAQRVDPRHPGVFVEPLEHERGRAPGRGAPRSADRGAGRGAEQHAEPHARPRKSGPRRGTGRPSPRGEGGHEPPRRATKKTRARYG